MSGLCLDSFVIACVLFHQPFTPYSTRYMCASFCHRCSHPLHNNGSVMNAMCSLSESAKPEVNGNNRPAENRLNSFHLYLYLSDSLYLSIFMHTGSYIGPTTCIYVAQSVCLSNTPVFFFCLNACVNWSYFYLCMKAEGVVIWKTCFEKPALVIWFSIALESVPELAARSETSSSSSNLDQESDRRLKDVKELELDFQRVTISGEDHSGVILVLITVIISINKQSLYYQHHQNH